MNAEKLTTVRMTRMTDAIDEALRILAFLDDRTISNEIRHLISLGLEQERERLLHTKLRPKQVVFVKRFLQLLGED